MVSNVFKAAAAVSDMAMPMEAGVAPRGHGMPSWFYRMSMVAVMDRDGQESPGEMDRAAWVTNAGAIVAEVACASIRQEFDATNAR